MPSAEDVTPGRRRHCPSRRDRRHVGEEVVQRNLRGRKRQERQRRDNAIVTMLPKFALTVIQMYFSVLAKVRRPSSTPYRNTSRSGSSSTTSALARATSTAASTKSRHRPHTAPAHR